MNKMSDPAQFQRRIIFMTMMLNDIIWRSKDNEQECELSASLVSIYAKRFPTRLWSFFGTGSEKKWYSTYNEGPRGEWDRVAELMMLQFFQSTHPIFRATSPLSRGTLKAKEVENYRYTSVPMGKRLKLFFTQSFLSISTVSSEQSQICVRITESVKQERGDPCWQDNLTHCSSQQDY